MLAGLGRLLTGKASRGAAQSAATGAALNAGFGLLTGGPVDALAYGAGDFLLNYPALLGARKLFPGKKQLVKDIATGKTVENYAPSGVEQAVNFGASFGANALVNAIRYPQPTAAEQQAQQLLAQQAQQINPVLQSQSQQTAQQLAQRSVVNRLPLNQLQLSPNTMYQMQGVEQTATNFQYPGLTLPKEFQAQLSEYVSA
jgi:hypothetical protein